MIAPQKYTVLAFHLFLSIFWTCTSLTGVNFYYCFFSFVLVEIVSDLDTL